MSQKNELRPLDLSIFQGWTFVAGVGNYNHKQACIMSALYLAVKIAEGKITLDKVLEPIPEYGPYADPLPEQDRVTCVSPLLREALISRNDAFQDDKARTEWASKMLPRIPGTMLGDKFEKKVKEALAQARGGRPWRSPDEEDKIIQDTEDDIEFMLGMINAEKDKRQRAQEKRRATLAAKKVAASVPPGQ